MSEVKTIERVQIRANEEEIQRFFDRLDQKTVNMPGFHIMFGQHILLLRFQNEETAERYRKFLKLSFTEYEGEPDGIITIWQGKIEDYLNLNDSPENASCWEYTGENGFIRYVKWQGRMVAYHAPGNRHYIILSRSLDEYVPFWAPFHWEFHHFSMTHGYAFVHSGAVGLNGEGVLISSVGGGGKSTTVLSCLLDGFDYVADDYLILEKGTVAAYPLFNSGLLNGDSLQRLPELRPLVFCNDPRKPDRYIIDLSRFGKQFCRGMRIKAIVRPRVRKADEPVGEALIRKDPLHSGKTQMLVSSARQNGFVMMRDQDALHSLFDAVSGLPSYELLLSPDRQSNCRALRELICSLSGTGSGSKK